MIPRNPFLVEGKWYRGNLHTHTTQSDGQLSIEATSAQYRAAGHDFIAVTDHDVFLHEEIYCHNLLVMPGIEVVPGGRQHIVLINPSQAGETKNLAPDDLARFIAPATLTIAAHPYWSGLTARDVAAFPIFDAIEVYNHVCERTRGKGYSSVHWDELLQTGRLCNAIAVDDLHHREDCARGWIMVKASDLTTEAIVTSVKNGLFYASTGVEVSYFACDETHVVVETASPVKTIDFIGAGPSGERKTAPNTSLTRAEFSINPAMEYLRVEITDWAGKKAWINPMRVS